MISAVITTLGVGILIVVLGAINMTGNISTLHEYHRKRVKEEDRKPFGKQVGLGTVLIGISILLYGILMLVADKTGNEVFITIGTAEMIVGLVVEGIITFRAMMKYNKGIF